MVIKLSLIVLSTLAVFGVNLLSDCSVNAAIKYKYSTVTNPRLIASSLTKSQKQRLHSLQHKIVVPSYVPPDFRVTNIEVENDENSVLYRIFYKNNKQSKFSINGAFRISGEVGSEYEYENRIKNIKTKMFGRVSISFGSNPFQNGRVVTSRKLYSSQAHLVMNYSYLQGDKNSGQYWAEGQNMQPHEFIKIIQSLSVLKN